MITAELIIAGIELTGKLAAMWKGRAKFADGTTLEQHHIDAAKAKADVPWQSIEDKAKAELDALDKK